MVKKINREGIQRMVRNSQTAGSRVGGGGGGGGLSSVALYQLTDVLLTDPVDMDALVYSGSLSKWVNGMVNKLGPNGNIVYGGNYLQFKDYYASTGTNVANAMSNPTADWYYHLMMNHANNNGYYFDLAACFNYNFLYYRRIVGGSAQNWVRIIDSNNIGDQSVAYATNAGYATSAGNADTVDGYHASDLWRSNGATWNPGANVTMNQSANDQEWSFDFYRNGYSGGYWHVWDSSNGSILVVRADNANVGIGTISPSYKLHVNGVAYASTGVYSAGYVTALSDIRMKDVVEHFVLKAADIAKASLIKFTWKDKHDTDIHAGGIAQEWQKILPESVRETAEGELAMDYGVIAVAASVSLAREVVSLQKKVNSLEARIARLEKMFAINNNDIED